MTIYEGTIITCDGDRSIRRFLVEDRGRILHVGDELPAGYAAQTRVSLGGKALLPAFSDTHIHFMSHSLFHNGLDVRGAASIEDLVALVENSLKSHKGKILIGFGASPHSVAEGRLVEKGELDRVSQGRPVYLVKYDGHAAIANTALLELLGDRISGERGYNAGTGLLTQEAFFRATDAVTGTVSLPATLRGMIRTMDDMAAKGIGLVHSVTGVGFPLDLDVALERLFARGLRNPVAYRIFFQTMDTKKVLKRRLPRIGGCFATALDGCFGSVDAALLEPYADDRGNSGVLYYDDERVKAFAVKANRAGLQIELHAIGDRAFRQAVDALSAALEDTPREDHRHTIIHACLPTREGLETCARLGIGIAVQSAFLDWKSEPLPYLEEVLGKRAYSLSPLRTMVDLGIRMSGGSDAPCTPPDPIEGIRAACNHYVDGESLSVQEAIDLYTRNAAWMSFDDAERGSLEAGKIADMVILNRSPFIVERKKLGELKVEQLLLSGRPYQRGQGMASLLLRGLFSRRRT